MAHRQRVHDVGCCLALLLVLTGCLPSPSAEVGPGALAPASQASSSATTTGPAPAPPPDLGPHLPGNDPPLSVHATSPGHPDGRRIPVHGVFELTLARKVDYGPQENFEDVDIRATFTGPSGDSRNVRGFFYHTLSDGTSMWKVRFAPDEEGAWIYDVQFAHRLTGALFTSSGGFAALAEGHVAFLEQSPDESRHLLSDGEAFFPIGLNSCVFPEGEMPFDGGDRVGAFGNNATPDEYLAAYAQAGFNTFRLSQANCSPALINRSSGHYDPEVAMYFDWLCQRLRANGYHVFFNLFGFLLSDYPQDPPPNEVRRFVRYCVDRWGAYASVWELLNERNASAAWINTISKTVRNRDPYDRPVTTSWARAELAAIEIQAPHWYSDEDPSEADTVVAFNARGWRAFDKPVIVGEHGNRTPPGMPYGNWLPDSALRMRIRTWTGLFHQVGFLFWNESWSTNANGSLAANIYLGDEERRYVQVLRWFSELVASPDLAVPDTSPVTGLDPATIRSYALTSAARTAVYFRRVAPGQGEIARIDVPATGVGTFIDPGTGAQLGSVALQPGPNQVALPSFAVDLAFFSEPGGVPATPPLAILAIQNPQDDGDLDGDGRLDWGPAGRPFGLAPLTLTFDASGSYDLDGGPLTIDWSFGDGSTDQGPIVSHTYAEGDFFLTLSVTDDEGRSATHSVFVRTTADARPNKNDPPTLRPMADLVVKEGELVVVTPLAGDRELNKGTYQTGGGRTDDEAVITFLTPLPEGAVFESWRSRELPRLWWVPSFEQSGTYVLPIRAQDEDGATSPERNLVIHVRDVPGQVIE